MNNEALEFLTQGSVWVKEDGKQAKVLWITNTTLSERQQQANPAHIVYVNEENNVYSRTLESFFKIYQFYNIDPELESRLQELLVFSEDDYEGEGDDSDDEDGDETAGDEPLLLPLGTADGIISENLAAQITAEALKLTQEDTSKLTKPLADYLAEEDHDIDVDIGEMVDGRSGIDEEEGAVTFTMSQGEAPAHSPEELQAALVSYVQEPNKQLNLTQHKLTFLLGNGVTIPSLKDTFVPDDMRSIVDTFMVNGMHHSEVIEWTDYIGTYPEIVYGREFASVILATENSPLISEEEAQAHIHQHSEEGEVGSDDSQAFDAAWDAHVNAAPTEEELAEMIANAEPAALPDTPAEIFIPQLSVVADSIEELNRQQAGQTNLIGNEIPPNVPPINLPEGLSAQMIDGILTIQPVQN
jgi:hypothetical protein